LTVDVHLCFVGGLFIAAVGFSFRHYGELLEADDSFDRLGS
jgi:hypothetical protein